MASSSLKLFDAFISHRGPDVKETLAKGLYQLLHDRGCRAFLDRPEIEVGDSIITAIESAICSSIVQIAIFSKGYADSSWCLDELVLMLEQQKSSLFIPVFYDVKPSDLRYIKDGYGQYAAAFSRYVLKERDLDKLDRWKEALVSASNVKGFEYNNNTGNLCKEIVYCVETEMKKRIPLQVATYPVGLDELVRDFESSFAEPVKIAGIFGLGGSGKTTMAKEIFNKKRSEYDASCFLYDVRESNARRKLHVLQKQLLKDLFSEDREFQHTEEGTPVLKHRLEKAKSSHFLIVIDDIDRHDQLEALLYKDLVSRNSLVIVTTRDEGVLKGADISNRYKMKTMDNDHAKELFRRHAFGGKAPTFPCEELVERFVQFCGGLPLSLKVMGTHVCGRDEKYWNLELEKAREIQPNDVRRCLQISYNSLDSEEKHIFMDIACFFTAILKDTAMEVLKKSCRTTEHAVQRLIDKCLVELEYDEVEHAEEYTITPMRRKGEVFRMHDHLRDLGRQMADEANPPRLWRPEHIRSKFSTAYTFARATEPRMVFAHYMLYEPDGVETLRKEIQLANSKGIDAFALNSNVWRPNRADDMFQAAEDSGTDFKLFFSADMSINSEGKALSSEDLIAMLTTYADHPNHLKYNGKLFFAAWLGEKTPWPQIFQAAGGRDRFFFVPFFPTNGGYDSVREKLNDFKDVIDGLSAWDTSAWPYEHSNPKNPPSGLNDQNYLKACKQKGKLYMANASPWFFKNLGNGSCSSAICQVEKDINECNCQVKGNYEGPGLWIEKWKQLIRLNPPFVRIVTWNDWQESTYVAPPYSAAAKKFGTDTFNHMAFLELGEHYIKWYKSGQEPALGEEAVYLFYYTQSKSISGTSDGGSVLRVEGLSDNLYVTTTLKSSAEVEVTSGGISTTFSGAVGINTYSMPFQAGQQSAVLKRGGAVVRRLSGGKDITNSPPANANLNVYSTCTKNIFE